MHGHRLFRLLFYASVSFIILPCLALADGPRPWDASIRLYAGYDDNVPLESDSSTFSKDEDSAHFGTCISGLYRIVQNSQWRTGVGVTLIQNLHVNSDVNDYDLTTVSPSLFADYSFDAWGKPSTAGMTYLFRQDWLGGDSYEKSHTLTWDVGIRLTPTLQSSVYYHLAFEDFDNEGSDPDRSSRDTTNHKIGANATYSFDRNRRSVMLNYEYGRNRADGDNFVFNSNSILVRFTTLLIRPLWLVLDASYSDQDYTRYNPTPRRTQDNQNYRAMLLLPINQNLTADLSYSYSKYDGNESRYDAERKKLALGATYRF